MKFDESLLYNIKSDYQGIRYSLFDLAIWKNGLAFKKIDFSDKGLPVIKIAELNNGISSNTSFTQGDYGKEVFVQWDDLLFSWSGNPQTSIDVFRYRLPDGWLNQHIFKVTANSELVTKDFLYYTLKYLKPYFTQIAINKQTTGLGHVTIADLKRMSVVIPKKEIQEQVTSILKVIDDKIEVNSNINENLEQQIEAIFNNKYAPSLCSPNWVVGTIGDVVTLQRGYDLPKDKMVSGSYPVAGSTDTIFYHNEYTTEAPCVVMGRSGNIGKPRLYMERCWAHNTTLFVKDFKGNNPYWSYYMLRSIDYSQFRGGSAVPTLNRNHVHSFEISIPPVSQQNEFAEIILPLLLLIENNRKEIKRLSTLREALLPKLMAGEFDVSNIQL